MGGGTAREPAISSLRTKVTRNAGLAEVEGEPTQIPGVLGVHDTHLWTLTSGMDVATGEEIDAHSVLEIARTLRNEHGIEHATLQVEPDTHTGCAGVAW